MRENRQAYTVILMLIVSHFILTSQEESLHYNIVALNKYPAIEQARKRQGDKKQRRGSRFSLNHLVISRRISKKTISKERGSGWIKQIFYFLPKNPRSLFFSLSVWISLDLSTSLRQVLGRTRDLRESIQMASSTFVEDEWTSRESKKISSGSQCWEKTLSRMIYR